MYTNNTVGRKENIVTLFLRFTFKNRISPVFMKYSNKGISYSFHGFFLICFDVFSLTKVAEAETDSKNQNGWSNPTPSPLCASWKPIHVGNNCVVGGVGEGSSFTSFRSDKYDKVQARWLQFLHNILISERLSESGCLDCRHNR